MQGRIIKLISNNYTVLIDSKFYVCKSRGRFRNDNIRPTVGDIVTVDLSNNYILEVHPRKNLLTRPMVSNIDQVVIIASLKEPDFSTFLLDKLLVIIEYNNITPIICFTKLDLLTKDELDEFKLYFDYYKKLGYKVYLNTETEEIKKIFKDKITVFTGQSGAGKSTLLNKLDSSLNILTAPISKALGRGKHTTRHVELISLFDGLVADTPGFSSINFNGMTQSDIRDNMVEFNLYRHDCEYKDCLHNKENKCKIKAKTNDNTILQSRYDNYIKFIGEV